MNPDAAAAMRASRASVLVGAASRTTSTPLLPGRACRSPASSTGTSGTTTPATPLRPQTAKNRSGPKARMVLR